MNSTWEMFFWAMLHHADFKYCYINLPVSLELRSFKDWRGRGFAASLHFKMPKPYIPWTVREEFFKAQGVPDKFFDEIPF